MKKPRTLRGLRHALVLPLVSVLAVACSGDNPAEPTPAPPAPKTVKVTPENPQVNEGSVVAFSATVLDQYGKPMPWAQVTWAIADQGIGSIDAAGTATGLESGTTEVTATAGTAVGKTSLRVRETVVRVVVTATDSALFLDQTVTFTATVLDNEGEPITDRAVVWTSTAPAVVEVGQTGQGRALAEGSARVTAAVEGVQGSVDVESRANPVLPTSYENFNRPGYLPVQIPLGPSSSYFGTTEEAHGFGDFYGRGAATQDLFTASVVYDPSQHTESQAPRSVLRFWRNEGGTFVQDNSILRETVSPCLHPRKALVADYNLDGRPDVFLICHGYDKAPFPGEPNQVLLSEQGGYRLVQAAPTVGFWHGGAAADLTGDGYPDVLAVIAGEQGLFVNDRSGTFQWVPSSKFPSSTNTGYYNLELLDANADGHVDIAMGGHEWESPTRIWINPGSSDFSSVNPLTIPPVEGEGVVAGFAATGPKESRIVWVVRTGGTSDMSRFYDYPVLQRYDLATGAAEVVLRGTQGQKWVPWLMTYSRSGASYVGSSDLRKPLEYAVP